MPLLSYAGKKDDYQFIVFLHLHCMFSSQYDQAFPDQTTSYHETGEFKVQPKIWKVIKQVYEDKDDILDSCCLFPLWLDLKCFFSE